jgi:type VI secretion system protein
MTLKVKVISYRGLPPVEPLEVSFDQDGGTLGRTPNERENHLTLPDPEQFISRRHASITFENGQYYLTDTSVDGTYIQNKGIRVDRDPVLLADGDQLRIGDYELIIHIPSIDTPGTVQHDSSNFSEEGMSGSFFDGDKKEPKHSFAEDSLWWPDKNAFKESAEQRYTTGQSEHSPLRDAFTPPDIAEDRAQPGGLPKNFNFEELFGELDEKEGTIASTGGDGDATYDKDIGVDPLQPIAELPASSQHHSPVDEKVRHQIQLELFQILFKATGLRDASILQDQNLPELMRTIGVVFREMTNGLMMVLRGRSELKKQLQVPVTRIMPVENNPLKFFKNVDETIKQFLIKDPPGFIDAHSAVREGFADIMNHQMAMNAGLQAALIDLIGRFDPQRFAKTHEDGIVFQKKAKAWDVYQEAYKKIANEALENIFGKSFADAYEAQLQKLASKPKPR